jgi:hypothetical protein
VFRMSQQTDRSESQAQRDYVAVLSPALNEKLQRIAVQPPQVSQQEGPFRSHQLIVGHLGKATGRMAQSARKAFGQRSVKTFGKAVAGGKQRLKMRLVYDID